MPAMSTREPHTTVRALALILLLATAQIGCGDSDDTAPQPTPTDTATPDDSPTPPLDTGPALDEGPDTPPPPEDTGPPPPEPAPIQVGTARARIPVPVGVGTAGFGQLNFSGGGPESRYAVGYPATRRIYTHPSMHAVVVEGQPNRVVFVRLDLIGINQEARQALLARIVEKGGPDLEQELLIAATHTHSGPGRLIDNPVWAAIADQFFPEFYVRMIDGMADLVLEALADVEPARFGWTVASTDALHGDRRCQNPDLLDPRMPLLRFDRMDGTPKAIIAMYSVHGTVIDADENLFSRDFHGGIELKLEEQYDSPVTALFFNSWSGDTSPKTGDVEHHYGLPHDYNGIESAGNTAAGIITTALEGVQMHDELIVRSAVARIPLNREALGYPDDVFVFEWGAVYCGAGADEVCWGEDPPPAHLLTTGCIPFGPDNPAPLSTLVGVFQIDDMVAITMPGEPVTSLGLKSIDEVAAATGLEQIALLGYAQDYIGYSLPEDDWYMGGYESSGSLWGPKQGDYVAARLLEFATHVLTGAALPWESLPRPEPKTYDLPQLPIEAAVEGPEVAVQPNAKYTTPDELIEVTIFGGDPWLLAPTATVELQNPEGTFEPLRRKNGSAVSTDGYELETRLEVTPTYEDTKGPVARTFAWTFLLPTRRGAPTTTPALDGNYRLRITGLVDYDTPYDLTTDPFSVVVP